MNTFPASARPAPPPVMRGTYRVAIAYCDICRGRTLSPTVETIRLDGGRWGAAFRCANCSMLVVLAPHTEIPAGMPSVEIPCRATSGKGVRHGHARSS